jgi:hypothetical protein
MQIAISVSFISAFIGAVLVAIGGFIFQNSEPKITNNHIRTQLDPKRPDAKDIVTHSAYLDAMLTNPKSRWWSGIGLAFVVSGMVALVLIMFWSPFLLKTVEH